MLMARLMRSRAQGLSLIRSQQRAFSTGLEDHPSNDPKNQVPFESSRLMTADRFEDEPEPAEEDQIVTHYLKHHPLYEFKDMNEFHVDGYRHWLHGRVDYLDEETYPAQISPWEQGSKLGHMFFVLLPFLSFFYVTRSYREHLKQKNVKMMIVGVFSQDHI